MVLKIPGSSKVVRLDRFEVECVDPERVASVRRHAEIGIAGISIGSNDLTHLLLGADRDPELVGAVFDERGDGGGVH